MNELRIMTVRQPWAWAIVHGGKDVENRPRNIADSYRGTVAIHAGLAPYEKDTKAGERRSELYGGEDPTTMSFGAIIGVVDLVDVHDIDSAGCYDDTEWAEDNAYHLVLANPRPLADPIPFKGALGLRRLDEETIALITAQLRGASS